MSGEQRIVLLGKTGAGKSSLANTIFGEKVFTTGNKLTSETKRCQEETRDVGERRLTLIDTPGFFDMDRPEEEIKKEIVSCIVECSSPGIDAFLLVLKVERFTKHENEVIDKILEAFGDEALKYTTIVFTHGDQLEDEETIEDLVRKNEKVRNLVEKCGGRCHVVDNKHWGRNQQDGYRSNQFQVRELLNTIQKMVEDHQSRYTNEMLQKVEKMKKEEEEHIRQKNKQMTEEEIQTKVKENVNQRLLKIFAGVTTGVLLGALFGAAAVLQKLHAAPVALMVAAVGGGLVGGAVGYEQGVKAESVMEAVANTSTALDEGLLKNLNQKYLH